MNIEDIEPVICGNPVIREASDRQLTDRDKLDLAIHALKHLHYGLLNYHSEYKAIPHVVLSIIDPEWKDETPVPSGEPGGG